MTHALSLTVFAKSDGPLTKRISLAENGSLKSDGSACIMARGTARRFEFSGVEPLAALIEQLSSHEALALGTLRPDLPDCVDVVTKRKLNGAQRPDIIARTTDYLAYGAGLPALALVDYDNKAMPHGVRARIDELGGLWPALVYALPALSGVAHVTRSSTSAGLYRTDTGAELPGSSGLHVFVLVQNGMDSERFLKTLHLRCWLAGLGWMMVGAGGQLLERSIVDRVVGSPERLVFEGPPILDPPLAQHKESRRAVATPGEALDTVAACPSLTIPEQAKFRELRAKEAVRLGEDARKARNEFVAHQAQRFTDRTGLAQDQARRVIERQCDGILLPDIVLPFDDEEFVGATVADVLADPGRFEGTTLADPLEGVEYGTGKAKVLLWADGRPWINSFAHGRTVYELQYDYRSADAALNNASAGEVADVFVRCVLGGDLGEDEIERLRNLADKIGVIGKRPLDTLLKKARRAQTARRRQEEHERRLAERCDPRPQIPAPPHDAPWLPQMAVLNEVLGANLEPEPPMRDIDDVITRVRVRRTPNMHAFTALGANEEETEETQLPPPEQPLLTRLGEPQLAEMIERYIDYVDERTGRSVHLGSAFVHHFHTRDDNKLPLAVAIATLPIVLGNGTLLAGRGLDRERGIIFRVPSELSAILPNKMDCTAGAVAEAMRFLADEWLCDVACDYTGKCTLIAAALTIIERSLLPDRPAFWVTAGRRGGGKTTTIIMLLMAVTGIRPAAAAWSPNEEERRKALLAYLLEALPAIVWDNIPRGSQISCPHIEKSCTSAMYSDRKLGVSETIATSAATIHFFTGNNIGPRGDLASRSLNVRLSVDRSDPENRKFCHPDPIAWTEAHRGKILAALYTLLLGNPLFRSGPVPPQTRFKTWWSLIGRAVEYAAKQHKEHVAAFVVDAHPTCLPTLISFKDVFRVQEEEDEESASLADALAVLANKWPKNEFFQASDVAKIANATGEWANEREAAMTLRDFLFPGTPPSQAVTAKATGKRLKRHVDEPVPRNGQTLNLKEERDPHTKTLNFYVASRAMAG